MLRNTELSLVPTDEIAISPSDNAGENLLDFSLNHQSEEKHRIQEHLSRIHSMAQLTSSGITVYDFRKNCHIYVSGNFYNLFGYNIDSCENEISNDIFDKKVHPEDLEALAGNGLASMQFLSTIPPSSRLHYKMINEYRIIGKDGNYVMVTEQHQILEQDSDGNTWLSLAVIDISPNQEPSNGVNFQIHNFQTGEFIFLNKPESSGTAILTNREKVILKLISDGKLSKEIAAELEISVHTVNTHRQRILEKLEVDNSIEAITKAKRLGL